MMIAGEDYEALVKVLKCRYCFKRLNPPVMICSSNGCIKCPHCSKFSPGCERNSHCTTGFLNPDCIFNLMLKLFPVECTYTSQGCSEKMQMVKIIPHERICDYRNVKCFACESSVVFAHLNEHIVKHDDEPIFKTNFSNHVEFKINPKEKKYGYFIFFVETVKKHFLFAYHFYDSESSHDNGSYHNKKTPQQYVLYEKYIPFYYQWRDSNYFVSLNEKINEYFEFCLQCVGKKSEACSYLYEFKIDQGLSSYYIRTAKSTPYMDETNAINFSTSDVFLNKEYESGFNMWIAIKPAA